MKMTFVLLGSILSFPAFGGDLVTADYHCRGVDGKNYEANVHQYARIFKHHSINLYPDSSSPYSLQPEEYDGVTIGFDKSGKPIEKARLDIHTLNLKLDCTYFDKSRDPRYGENAPNEERVPASKPKRHLKVRAD